MPLSRKTLVELDDAHTKMFNAVKEFFRYAKRHPDAQAEVQEYFDDAYFQRVAGVLHDQIDHEIKHLHNPYID